MVDVQVGKEGQGVGTGVRASQAESLNSWIGCGTETLILPEITQLWPLPDLLLCQPCLKDQCKVLLMNPPDATKTEAMKELKRWTSNQGGQG